MTTSTVLNAARRLTDRRTGEAPTPLLGAPHTHEEGCWCRTRSAPARVMRWQPGDPVARFGPAGAA